MERSASFGFREVAESEKAGLVRRVFDSVAPRYDLMNDLMSFGVHRLWKAALVDEIALRPGETLIDVAGGTGDVALAALAAAPGARAVLCDVNPAMVGLARDRALDRGVVAGLSYIVGDAERLPMRDRSVEAYAIAFGLRNVTRIDAALAEARRVLRPGGRFFCLEFSRVTAPGLAQAYDAYSFGVLPRIGRLVAGDGEAYRYLVESIRRFPAQDELTRLIEAAGLARARYRNLTGGVAAIHAAWWI